MNTVKIDGPDTDCKTNGYIEVILSKKNAITLMYSYIIKPNGELEELTSDNIDKYMGKKIKLRFAEFCKSKNGVCHRCAGNFFYRRGSDRIGLACQTIPTTLKLKAMKAFHDSTINTTKIDAMKVFGFK